MHNEYRRIFKKERSILYVFYRGDCYNSSCNKKLPNTLREVFLYEKEVVSVILAMTMVASMAMGCGSGSDTTTSDNSTTTTTNDAAASTEASDAADATADAASGDLADKKSAYVFISSLITS